MPEKMCPYFQNACLQNGCAIFNGKARACNHSLYGTNLWGLQVAIQHLIHKLENRPAITGGFNLDDLKNKPGSGKLNR